MPKNVMKLAKRVKHTSRNDFDLSHRHLFSANFGEILPISFIETVPGDYMEIRVSDLLRAIPMVTSPFLRAKQHVEIWFTPYNYLWSNFEQFMTERQQPTSSSLSGSAFVPHEKVNFISGIIQGAATDTDVVGRPYIDGASKIFDLCGYGRLDSTGTVDEGVSVNLWRIAQYQKVWYDEYRQDVYDDGLRFLSQGGATNAALMFNFDDLPCTSEVSSRFSGGQGYGDAEGRVKEMFQMRYRPYKKDLFTGMLPSTQFGNVSVVMNNQFGDLKSSRVFGPNFNIALAGTTNTDSGAAAGTVGFFSETATGNSLWETQFNVGFDILQLRQSEAIQIWREAALTAGNRVSDNMRAHYGDDAYYDDKRSTFIGSVDAPLNIGDIDSTAQIGDGANQGLADVAGKGLSSLDEKVFRFNAKYFGSIMITMSLLPEAEYESYGIDRMNQLLEHEDYFVNEYMNLGFEAVSSQNFYTRLASQSKVFGYAPRYYGYKQKLDKCFGAFRSNGIFRNWSSPKYDVTQMFASDASVLPLSLLYVNPALYNNNFSVFLDNSDQFLCDVYFDVAAVREMSVTGLPQY